jgi:EAL domain-containing protein (putative c-di-GMP-specific phosphodiesterase class I)
MSDGRLRVLAIDDEAGITTVIRKAVEGAGHEAIATTDIDEFKNAVKTWLPALVIIDINMPGCDGVELLHYLAEAGCTAQICVSSGLDDSTIDAVIRIGNDSGLKMGGKLAKPMRLADLQQVLEKQASAAGGGITAADLAQAIKANQLFLEYQPILDCKLGRITAVEALVRWRHPRRGVVLAGDFIGLVEENGLIDSLTDWVVTHAAQQMAVWHRQSLPLEIAVNISAENTRDSTLPDRLAQLCRNNLANPNAMLLELSETSAMNDMAQMMDVLTRLRVRGFKLSIDDFGTGCSSLVHLQRMPFSDMKIDRSFVTQMTQSRDRATIVEIIIELARKLGRRSVATGVENQITLDQLVKLGCGAAQGYHLGAPTVAERIPEMVRGYNPARARAVA